MHKLLSVDEIDLKDRRFCISFPMSNSSLFLSIERSGLIYPLVFWDRKPFIIISGFKRMEALMKRGYREIPGIIKDVSEKEAAIISIHTNLERGLNIVEKAHAIKMLLDVGFEMGEIFETMKSFGLEPRQKIYDLLIRLSHADEELKNFIVSRKVTKKNIENLLWFEKEERKKIIEVLSNIRTTEASLTEMLTMFMLLKTKKGILDLEPLKSATKFDEMKNILKRILHPELSSMEKTLREYMKSVHFPPNIKVFVDPNFERDEIEISIRLKRIEELDEALERISIFKHKIGGLLELARSIC